MHGTMDFETASAAGFVWHDDIKKWKGLKGAPSGRKGLSVIGANAYAEHPSTRVLCLHFKLPGDQQPERWRPGLPLPQRLFDYIAAGGLIEAHYAMFERLIWTHVCVPRHGFPPLPPAQLQCSMATARVNSYPGKLADLGDVLKLAVRKDADGRRLLNKFSIPRNPTKTDPRVWITPEEDPADAERLYSYCDDDVLTEEEASSRIKPMTPAEREFWLEDQAINWRGIGIDRQGIRDCIAVLDQALERYGAECLEITGGIGPTQVQKLQGWLHAQGVYMHSLDADAVEEALNRLAPHPPTGYYPSRRVLEIRALVGSASVKKLYAMENQACRDDRLRDLIVHHGARTGRPTGEGPQPLNLPKAGPKLVRCGSCSKPYKPTHNACPWCSAAAIPGADKLWTPDMIDAVLEIMAYRSLDLIEWYFGDALLAISGCIRGLFVAGPGMDLIASDYSAIEAVVTAMLAGEQWRIEAFRNKKDIYLSSASHITGVTVATYEAYHRDHGEHHPDRQEIGKPAELGLGFGGWISAWRVFDSSDKFNDAEVKKLILDWRAASPAIVEMWGGQWRGVPWDGEPERYGFEGAAVNAIEYPGQVFQSHGIKFERRINQWGDALIITLLSGRELTYHSPELNPSTREWAAPGELSITYWTDNKNPKMGPLGWIPMSTFGGRLTENIVQATAHDILRFAILNLRAVGYPTVLHVYDEICVELSENPAMPKGVPDPWVADVERIMMIMPPWAADWPIRATGGWRGKRYRKS